MVAELLRRVRAGRAGQQQPLPEEHATSCPPRADRTTWCSGTTPSTTSARATITSRAATFRSGPPIRSSRTARSTRWPPATAARTSSTTRFGWRASGPTSGPTPCSSTIPGAQANTSRSTPGFVGIGTTARMRAITSSPTTAPSARGWASSGTRGATVAGPCTRAMASTSLRLRTPSPTRPRLRARPRFWPGSIVARGSTPRRERRSSRPTRRSGRCSTGSMRWGHESPHRFSRASRASKHRSGSRWSRRTRRNSRPA